MSKQLARLFMLLGLGAAVALAVTYGGRIDPQAIRTWITAAGMAGPALFILAYALATVFFLPGSVLTLAGGALFGPWWGTLFNLTGATLGAALAFLVSRHVAADRLRRRVGPRASRLIEGVEAEGWRFVAFTRLVPLFPFFLLNYALGLTRISFPHYVVATAVCMAPSAFAFTWLGFAGREAVAGGEGLVQTGLIALALVAAVAFLPRLVMRLRNRPTGEDPETADASVRMDT
jgi:uncharacterized membrane protein YdjX (TVP38/TMEM64 family)